MRRARGRPGKDKDDVGLVMSVRGFKALGLTVEAACRALASQWTEADRRRRGYDEIEEVCAAQLKKRYERIKREYISWEPKEPRLRAIARAAGLTPRIVRRKTSAASPLKGRPHKKPPRRSTLH